MLVLRCCLKRESTSDGKKQKASERKHNGESGVWFLSPTQHLEGSEARKAIPKTHLVPPPESKPAGMAVTQCVLQLSRDGVFGGLRRHPDGSRLPVASALLQSNINRSSFFVDVWCHTAKHALLA